MFSQNVCVVCNDSISDPVCGWCYIKQIRVLLSDFGFDQNTSRVVVEKIKGKFFLETINGINCILCMREEASFCRYCFSVVLTRVLRELDFSEEVIESFGYEKVYGETNASYSVSHKYNG